MAANGTLTGAGGGAVTISGLGTTGAVGSGNIFPNGDFLASSGGVPTNVGIYNNAGIANTASVNAGGPLGSSAYLQITANAAGATQWGLVLHASAFGGFKANTNYVVSFYAAANGAMAGHPFYVAFNDAPVVQTWLQNPNLLAGSWQRYVILVNWGGATIDPNIFFSTAVAPNSGDILDFACVQVEQGDAPSGWAPVAYVDGGGAIQGVQGGAGTTVANSLLTAPIARGRADRNLGQRQQHAGQPERAGRLRDNPERVDLRQRFGRAGRHRHRLGHHRGQQLAHRADRGCRADRHLGQREQHPREPCRAGRQ